MFWNVENFFDWRNDSTTVSDLEFSAAGERHWTWKRFQAKANAFAKALFWVETETGTAAALTSPSCTVPPAWNFLTPSPAISMPRTPS